MKKCFQWVRNGSVHADSPGKNTGVGYHALLQGIFPTQGQNPGLPHCRQILYYLGRWGDLEKEGMIQIHWHILPVLETSVHNFIQENFIIAILMLYLLQLFNICVNN